MNQTGSGDYFPICLRKKRQLLFHGPKWLKILSRHSLHDDFHMSKLFLIVKQRWEKRDIDIGIFTIHLQNILLLYIYHRFTIHWNLPYIETSHVTTFIHQQRISGMVVSSGPWEFGCKKVTLVNRSVEKAQEVLEDDMVSWRTGSVVRKLRYEIYVAFVNFTDSTWIWNLYLNLNLEFGFSELGCGILLYWKKHIVGFGYGFFSCTTFGGCSVTNII